MRVPEAFDFLRPSANKLRGIIQVSEEQNRWVRGTFVADPTVTVEMSFELALETIGFLNTNMTYLGAWRSAVRVARKIPKPVIEYQLGRLVSKPSPEDWELLIKPLVECLGTYYPPIVTRDT